MLSVNQAYDDQDLEETARGIKRVVAHFQNKRA